MKPPGSYLRSSDQALQPAAPSLILVSRPKIDGVSYGRVDKRNPRHALGCCLYGGKMIKKIAVPLDGSKLAECALTFAEEIASHFQDSKIELISVTERKIGYRAFDDLSSPNEQQLVPEAVGKMERQATRYLNRIAKGLRSKGISVDTSVLCGKPAEEIMIYTKTEKPDLIIMASHGRSGPSRWAFGSVADKVSRSVNVPVMMIRAPGCGLQPKQN
jgi:nucleotide-binding universal stress UspA family protein